MNYRFRFIDNNPYIVEADVICRSGVIIKLPIFWIYQDIYVYFDDGYIEQKTVMFTTHSNAFVSIAAIYTGKKVLCRLKNKIPSSLINMTKHNNSYSKAFLKLYHSDHIF